MLIKMEISFALNLLKNIYRVVGEQEKLSKRDVSITDFQIVNVL